MKAYMEFRQMILQEIIQDMKKQGNRKISMEGRRERIQNDMDY